MRVEVSFALEVDTAEWMDRNGDAAGYGSDARQVVAGEVRAHAENVVRDLYEDQGWIPRP
jgi:hypothetical protein